MMLLIALSFFATPISLDGISIKRARSLHGKPVAASFLGAKPAYMLRGHTILGAADRDDGAERGVVLKGNRFDIPEGNRVTVVGVLRVIDHAPAFVNGQVVPAWVEIRVVE